MPEKPGFLMGLAQKLGLAKDYSSWDPQLDPAFQEEEKRRQIKAANDEVLAAGNARRAADPRMQAIIQQNADAAAQAQVDATDPAAYALELEAKRRKWPNASDQSAALQQR